MRDASSPTLNRDSVTGMLYEEFLVTKQMGTGSGEAWIPLAAEGPGGKFKGEELGLAFDHGPSIFSNVRGLGHKNERRRRQAHVGEYDSLAREAKANGIKPKGMPPEPVGCSGCVSCAPNARKAHSPRDEKSPERWWRPENPNQHGRGGILRRKVKDSFGNVVGEKRIDIRANRLIREHRKAIGEERDRRPDAAETRRRQLRGRAKDAAVVVRDGQLVREGAE